VTTRLESLETRVTRLETANGPTCKETGEAGGKARMSKLTAEQRQSIARRAAKTRWKKHS
jgi:hypothetical protein